MVRRISSSLTVSMGCVAAVVTASAPGHSLEQKRIESTKSLEVKAAPSDVQQFCVSNAALIGNARIAWQTARLVELDARIRIRLVELESKKAEYEAWLRKRDEMMKQATDGVVTIYAKMKPDAAALQLTAMDDPIAAAILSKLPPRSAGAILDEMEAGRAARLTRSMSGPESAPDGRKS